MRRFLPLLGAIPLLLLAPAPAQAGTCPALPGGVVDRMSYRLGQTLDFWGTYHDFANPGTVTIEFVRASDGATRSFTAANSPDGSWYLMLTFDSEADLGLRRVTVVVTQNDAVDTCRDSVSIRARTLPDTSIRDEPPDPTGTRSPTNVIIGGLAVVAAATAARRFRIGFRPGA